MCAGAITQLIRQSNPRWQSTADVSLDQSYSNEAANAEHAICHLFRPYMTENLAMIIVLGTFTDEHVSTVVDQLKILSINCVVADYLAKTPVRAEVDSLGSFRLWVNNQPITGQILVWDRLKIWTPTLNITGQRRSAHYESQEWHAFYSLLTGVFADNVVNSRSSRICMIKPYQQIVAANAGFLVPPTCVTNVKADVISFLEKEPKLVLKSLSAGKVMPRPEENPIPSNVMTMEASSDVLHAASTDEIERCPHFLQRNVAKSFELRLVVVGEHMFAFRIDSQARESSKLDWRNALQHLKFEPFELPIPVVQTVRKFLDTLGLFAGSIDLIVDKDGRYWFLECNQDGQWSWLDPVVDGAISKAFANALASRLATTESRL